MEIYNDILSPVQEKLMKWAVPIIQNEFPDTKCVWGWHDDETIQFEIGCDKESTENMCNTLNKLYPVIHANIWYEDCGGAVPAGIIIKPTQFWHLDFEPHTFQFLRRIACKNEIPFDCDLHRKINKPGFEYDYDCKMIEDGFGIEGSYANHTINFKVEAIDYETCYDENCYENPNDPDWECECELVPCLWEYHGRWDNHYIDGFASSSTLAVGKMLQAIYKNAEKHCPEVSQGLKANFFRFSKYGYCY